jgi:putative flippase GtrA
MGTICSVRATSDRFLAILAPVIRRTPSSVVLSFVKFAGLSGLGWLLDACILIGLVSFAVLVPFQANIISSCTAALAVFLLSRELIFYKAPRAQLVRILSYLLYTVTVIFFASILLGALSAVLQPLAASLVGSWAATVAVAAAKVLVTPPQLLMNFLMSRFLSERRFAGLSRYDN